ncbi:MAG: thiamine pyrophosphate-dependent enzyme, partial [Thermoanaerobaculia bacterium]
MPDDFLREVHGFLALEAPFLIRGLPQVATEDELEEVLLERLGRRFQLGGKFAKESLYPNVQHSDAAGWNREAIEEQLRGFFERRRIKLSITNEERLELLRRMLLTRAVDEHLKSAFDRKSIKWKDYPSPQKGFRSTGQEAIVGACLRLRKPPEHAPGPDYDGDVIAPLIRDLGAVLMFKPDPLHPILVQYGKAGTPVGGRDLHVGDLESGVLPPAAPLAIATQTLLGIAQAMKVGGKGRVCVSFIGDGGSSLGEWHEAVNFAAVRDLPLVFIVENNLWALGTHVSEQTRAKRFSARAAGYGIPGVTLFGNDPEEVAAGVTWAADRAREGKGPALIELVTYRRPGHAHHDDVRFHGNPEAGVQGYENEAERRAWEEVDPVDLYEKHLRERGMLTPKRIDLLHQVARREVEEAVRNAEMAPWPESDDYKNRVFAPERPLAGADHDDSSDPGSKTESGADSVPR